MVLRSRTGTPPRGVGGPDTSSPTRPCEPWSSATGRYLVSPDSYEGQALSLALRCMRTETGFDGEALLAAEHPDEAVRKAAIENRSHWK